MNSHDSQLLSPRFATWLRWGIPGASSKGQIIGVAAVIAFLLTITITTVLQTLNQVHLDAQSDVQMSTIIQNYSEALGKVDDSSSAMLTQYQNLSPTAKLDTKIDFLLQEQATEAEAADYYWRSAGKRKPHGEKPV